MPVDSPNVGTALGLVCAAGGATGIGAAVVFFPQLVQLASKRVLAGSLGLAAGVMMYVSFVEIFQKSFGSFQDAGYEEGDAYLYATLSFFGGVVVMIALNLLVQKLSGDDHDHVCCSEDPAHELEVWQAKAKQEVQEDSSALKDGGAEASPGDGGAAAAEPKVQPPQQEAPPAKPKDDAKADERKLKKMGLSTALAIGLHNFPEGLATFVATLNDPAVGAVLAIAIGIHNVPEGLCVACPIYFATGNRWKAFLWALVSGVSEPIAALLGWAVLANSVTDETYAVLFGFVSGMMVMISVKELLPTAHRYDPQDTVVTNSFIVGMIIMALSLVLFMI